MMHLAPHKHRGSRVDDAQEQSDPGMLPVEPDQGLVPPAIPDDPEHDRMVDPEA
jgi:hypothetical protein